MDIKDIRDLQNQLAEQITKLVKNFEDATTMSVTMIDISRINAVTMQDYKAGKTQLIRCTVAIEA